MLTNCSAYVIIAFGTHTTLSSIRSNVLGNFLLLLITHGVASKSRHLSLIRDLRALLLVLAFCIILAAIPVVLHKITGGAVSIPSYIAAFVVILNGFLGYLAFDFLTLLLVMLANDMVAGMLLLSSTPVLTHWARTLAIPILFMYYVFETPIGLVQALWDIVRDRRAEDPFSGLSQPWRSGFRHSLLAFSFLTIGFTAPFAAAVAGFWAIDKVIAMTHVSVETIGLFLHWSDIVFAVVFLIVMLAFLYVAVRQTEIFRLMRGLLGRRRDLRKLAAEFKRRVGSFWENRP